ncbi:MAG: hypothetical protein P8Q90_05900, partial [Candidatus Thalassarchaeaceae archaeon]|nr:hypothetical protein [Candidatus Thalassarchaeaceae archaeon]
MERELFARLWEEVDFDDHPHSGGHNPEPEGELSVTFTDDSILLHDSRLSFLIGSGDADVDSIHRWTTTSVRMNEGPERLGVHRWSLSPSCLSPELSHWVNQRIGEPEENQGESVSHHRELLDNIRNHLSPLLPEWTWHLEVDNKADRMGWYVRAPNSWRSLFTIFAGIGRNQNQSTQGFVLFERAPPGELDRPDEAEPNRLDGLRTVALCNASRGALSHLAGDMMWATDPHPFELDLPGDVELWPPSMGRWPLLHGRLESNED